MQQSSKLGRIITFLQQRGYVVVEKKPNNKRGHCPHMRLHMIQPIASAGSKVAFGSYLSS